jgi:hypothetical protein
MRKHSKRLHLRVETVRQLGTLELTLAIGGLPRLSKLETDCCTAPGSDHKGVCQSEFASDCGSCG